MASARPAELPGVMIFLILAACSKSALRLDVLIQRKTDSNAPRADGRKPRRRRADCGQFERSQRRTDDVASDMLHQSQVKFSTISTETITQSFLFIRSDDAERPEHQLQPAAIKRFGPPPSNWSCNAAPRSLGVAIFGDTPPSCSMWSGQTRAPKSCRHQSQSRKMQRRLFGDWGDSISHWPCASTNTQETR
jgi:hypothetical protein